MMEKPITVLQTELSENIIKAINDSRLHPAIYTPIVKDIYDECLASYQALVKKEQEEYNASLNSEETDSE